MSAPLKTVTAAACAAIAAIAVTAPAHADVVNFGYTKSELETARGAANVYARMKRRAHSLCAVNGRQPLAIRRWEDRCEADLVEDFLAGIDDARLNQLHAAAQDARRRHASDGDQRVW